MKNIKMMLKLFLLLSCIPLLGYAKDNHSFTLKVTSDKPQSFFGAYYTGKNLIAINETTPFEVTVKSDIFQVMLGSKDQKTFITAQLIKEDQPKPLVMEATSRNIVMCNSYKTVSKHDMCAMPVK